MIYKNINKKQYQTRLLALYQSHEKEILNTDMDEYHNLKIIDHIASWPKIERTFSRGNILTLKNLLFIKK
jgi:hypothetical protein